jgi:hypothetical protein
MQSNQICQLNKVPIYDRATEARDNSSREARISDTVRDARSRCSLVRYSGTTVEVVPI